MEAATEMPQWRLPRTRRGPWIALYRKRAGKVSTSKMLRSMNRWYRKPNPRPSRQSRLVAPRQRRLLEFADASDRMWRHLCISSRRMSSRAFVELNLRSGYESLSKQEKLDTMCFLDAVDCIKTELLDPTTRQLRRSLGKEDVLELHKRVTGGNGTDCDYELLQPLISMLKEPVHDFGLAGRVLEWFHKQAPFEDGNARIGELLVSIILRKAMPGLPFPARVRALEAAKAGVITPSGGAADFAAFVVEQAWLACPCPKADHHVTSWGTLVR